MGVAAAYLGEMVTEELKTVAADRIVVVAPQEGQVMRQDGSCMRLWPAVKVKDPAPLLSGFYMFALMSNVQKNDETHTAVTREPYSVADSS